jgi:PhnB protein
MKGAHPHLNLPGTAEEAFNFYITLVEPETAEEAKQVFGSLAEGGGVEMPLGPTPWAELHGMCRDRFGVQWMVDHTGNADTSWIQAP